MINFKSLQVVVNDKYSFVGIHKQDDLLQFCLPRGFIEQDYTFSHKQDLFFLFYKILHVFKGICIEKGYLDNSSVKDRDGVVRSDSGSSIQSEEEISENIFYSKLDIIGKLLDAYDEPKILALAYRLGITDKFDVSKIHRHLHQAIFLPNNAAYVDQMTLPKRVIQFESTDIVTMYCYLFCEVKLKLKENVSSEILSLAERFRQKYLGSEDSIFDEQTYEQVLDILKDAFETIDHNTPIKDADFWQYYEAIELFLYGDLNQAENGEIWGISNFHTVWESMCLTYLAQNTNPSFLLNLDTRYVSQNFSVKILLLPKVINLSKEVFKINTSYLRPDAVQISVIDMIDSYLKPNQTYIISPDITWNDFGYHTLFKLSLNNKRYVSIAYNNQQFEHTISELQKEYISASGNSLAINKPLSKKSYSFWDISKENDFESLTEMYYFNHFFYLALKENIFDWESFEDLILHPFDINLSTSYNVFTKSLFRNYTTLQLKEAFTAFIQKVFTHPTSFLEIIDIKYLNLEYFHNPHNIEEIKQTSIRKQFVYEYLLQKEIEKRKDQFSSLRIQSSFWLPSDRPNDPDLLQDSEKPFMDNYIHLKNANFAILAESYIASASS